MSKQKVHWTSIALNVALGVLGVVALVLLYAFVAQSFLPGGDALREDHPATAALVGDIIQVEVRNGCGVSGLAAGMRQYLRGEGFDVVGVGDHTSFDQPRTLVVDRVGDLAAARKVATALGLAEDRVVQEIRQDYFLDASIIIGQDYKTLPPFLED